MIHANQYNKQMNSYQQRPMVLQQSQQQQQPRLYKGNSSSESAESGSSPSTPKIMQLSLSKDNGYDSDTSDEGRIAFAAPKIRGLRVVNPDEKTGSECSSAVTTPTKPQQEPVTEQGVASPSIHIDPANVYRPGVPLHKSVKPAISDSQLSRHESKTLAAETTPPMRSLNEHINNNAPYQPLLSPIPMSPITESASPKPAVNAVFASTKPSKYAKVSYHLTNDPTALKQYREMAEKTNDPTTQLMFAKYLLETANAFGSNPTQVVGSMWGLGSTTNKTQRPEPYFVVPPLENNRQSMSSYPNSSLSASNPQQSIITSSMKQQATLQRRTATVTPENDVKRKVLEQEGIKWIVKLSKENVPEACYMLAHWMDCEMYGYKKNNAKSLALHHIAAKGHVPESVFAVAEHDEREQISDPARIVRCYQIAADYGYVNALYKLAFLTIYGKLHMRQSLTDGLKLMYVACTYASEQFNMPPYVFGQMLTNEYEQVDFPQSTLEPYGGKEAAILYFERAARLGNYQAQSKLGSIYEHGLYGEAMNFARAFDYYEQAAGGGDSKAMLGLSRLNNRGSHGPGDQNEQQRLENDVSGWLAATPLDEDLSFEWCKKSANAGNPDAMALLGWYYECGFGVPRNFDSATEYYQHAAAKGNRGAQMRLRNMNNSITKQQHEGIQRNPKQQYATKDKQQKHNGCKCM